MGRISDSDKEVIRSRIDMVQLVSEYVTLDQRAPDDFWGRCPFHEEKRPSFHIRPNMGLFKCFGCGKGGDVFRFVEEIEGVRFGEALQRLASRAGVELSARTPEERARDERRSHLLQASGEAASFFQGVLWSRTPAGERGRDYLERRGISEDTARAFGLGVAPDSWSALRDFASARDLDLGVMLELGLLRAKDGRRPYDFFRDRFMFPIRDEQGKVIAFGGRTLGDDERKYMNSQEIPGFYEKRRCLYGLDRAKVGRPKRLVVVEGYMDVVVPHQVGRTEFVATLGTAFTPEQARLARRYVDEVVILFDADEAGQGASLRALANLVGEKGLTVKVASLPDGLDPDEAVRRDGGTALLDAALEGADDLIAFVIDQSLKGYELSSPAGQERAIRAATKLLARIPDKIRLFRELGEVARRFGLPEEVLREEVSQAEVRGRQGASRVGAGAGAGRRPESGRSPVASRPAGPVASAELHLLEALIALPDAAGRIAGEGGGAHVFTPGLAQALATVIFSLAAEGPVEPARVMGRLEDPAARDLCDRLIGRIDAEKDYVRDVDGWSTLQRRLLKRRRDELLRQIRVTTDEQTKKRLLEEHLALHKEAVPQRAAAAPPHAPDRDE